MESKFGKMYTYLVKIRFFNQRFNSRNFNISIIIIIIMFSLEIITYGKKSHTRIRSQTLGGKWKIIIDLYPIGLE